MLVHHSSNTNYSLFFTTSKGSYNVKRIQECLSENQRKYLLFCHAFTGCDTVSAIAGHGKATLYDKLCVGDVNKHMDIFLDVRATKDDVIRNGIAIFQYIYRALGTPLAEIRYNVLRKAAPEELLEFTSCNCKGDCSNRRCSCRKNEVKCISACRNCKGITCKNCIDDEEEPEEDSDLDS